MSREEFQRHQAMAKSLVTTWPKWKQNILENSSKPTVSVPRTPVITLSESARTNEPQQK